MTRVKRGTTSIKTRKEVLKKVKGYRWGRSKKERSAREAILHAGQHAFAHRRRKKGDFRKLWTIRVNAALKDSDISYSSFINMLKVKNTIINRKMLSQIAKDNPETFKRLVEHHK